MGKRGEVDQSISIDVDAPCAPVLLSPPHSPSLSPSSDETDAYTGTMNSRGTDDEGALLKGASKGQERDGAEESAR